MWWYRSIPIDVLLEEQGQLSTWRSHGCCCLENQECTRQCWECIFQKRNTSLSHGQSLHLQFSSPSLSKETQGHSFWDLGSYFEADPILTIQLPNFVFQSNVIGFWEHMCHLWQAEMWFSLFKKTLQKNVLPSQLVPACGRGLRWVQGAAGQVRHLFVFIWQEQVWKKLIWSCKDYNCWIHIKMFSYLILFNSEYNNVIVLTWKHYVLWYFCLSLNRHVSLCERCMQ